jgi:replicative DNA helicase
MSTQPFDFEASSGVVLAGSESWDDPLPFGSQKPPRFPVDSLPPWMREWVEAETLVCQVPDDLPGALAIGAASLASARLYNLRVRPDWSEPLNLWIAVALPPGERKSPVFKHAVQPVHDFLDMLSAAMAPKVRERALDRHVLAGQLEAAKSAAIKGKPYEGGDAMTAARELAHRLDELPEIVPPSLIADDVTPEALAIVLAQNGERIGIFSAEGGPLEIMGGRYTERGTNFEIFLKAHAGDTHIVNRVKREAVHLKQPLVTMAITVQPTVIEGLAHKEGFRGRGLLARFLYSLPESKVGSRDEDPPPISAAIATRYQRAFFNLLRGDPQKPMTLVMSQEADARRSAFQRALEPRLGPDGDLRPICDWANKLTGAVCRIAGVLHLAEHAESDDCPLVVSGDTFARAERLGEYFLESALCAFEVMATDPVTDLAKRTWAWVERKRLVEFTEREAIRATHATAEDMALALLKLTERNLVRRQSTAVATGGRPRGPTYDVAPAVMPQ